MKRRQTLPRQWLVADGRFADQLWPAVRALPNRSGVLFLYRDLRKGERARTLAKLRRLAATRGLVIVDEGAGEVARVHDVKEIRQAGIAGVPILFLSPMFPTRSHPGWEPIPRMRAAALLRLTKAPVMALGGVTDLRFRRIQRLGFSGWAAIDAWIRT
jgi:thiamine-phosphate pyrophosphorylase